MMTKVFALSFVDTAGTKQSSCQIHTKTAEFPQQISLGKLS